MVSQSVPSPLAGEGEGGGVPPSGGRRGIFYGWYIVAAGSGIQFLVGALLDGAVGGYAAALTRDYGWTRSALSGAFSVSRLLAGFANYPLGRMIDRLGPRVVMRAGLILYALGFFLFARLDSLPLFYAASILLAVGSNVGGFLPITTVMVNWFDRYRARAISLSFIGYAFGGLVAPAVILAITHDWRLTSLGSGLAVFAIGLPLTFLMHQRPELRGLRIDGATAAEAAHRDAEVAAARTSSSTISFTAGEAVRTRAFWMIALGHGSSLLVVAAVQVSQLE